MAKKTPTIPAKGEFPCPVIDPAIDPSKPNSKKNGAKSSPMQAYNTPIILATDITPNDLTMCIVDPLYQLCFILLLQRPREQSCSRFTAAGAKSQLTRAPRQPRAPQPP